jgi:hypothetical protein
MPTCSEAECVRPVYNLARSLCRLHYDRLRRVGQLAPIDYFWRQVAVGPPEECWEWRGCRTRDGYGVYSTTIAHRTAYARNVGPIPEGMHIDHICRNRACVNPRHLRALEPVENLSDSAQRNSPICPNGHAYTAENTRVTEVRGRPRRNCRACDRTRVARYRGRLARATS